MVSEARLALSDVTTSEALEKILLGGALVTIIKKLLINLLLNNRPIVNIKYKNTWNS